MKFPLIIIDFEASSLNMESYPIEVGLAVAKDLSGSVGVWSSLIIPDPEWVQGGDWQPASQQIHGISRESLAGGRHPAEIAETLNRIIEPHGQAWCDGGRYDGHWLKTLFLAARMKPRFDLWDISVLFALDRQLGDRFGDVMSRSAPPHRAGDDALRICTALLASGGRSNDCVSHLLDLQIH
jgi:hypothetical protein